MNEKEFNGLILAELVKIANDVFTNEIEKPYFLTWWA